MSDAQRGGSIQSEEGCTFRYRRLPLFLGKSCCRRYERGLRRRLEETTGGC
jgi:hypothetical protein